MLLTASLNDALMSIMTTAKPILKRRQYRTEESFVELSVFELPGPLAGSQHCYKYRLAYVVSGVCVLRYDNEAGKGDHKHIGEVERPYPFRGLEALLRDFFSDVQKMEG